jgi:HEAT repeat protein
MSESHESNEFESAGLPGDTSPFDAEAEGGGYNFTTDDAAVRDMHRRTTTFGKIATILILGTAVALGALYFMREKKHESQLAELERINHLENASEVPAQLRALLPNVENPELRARILLNLGYLKDAESVPLMVAALDTKGIVRRDAAAALAAIGSPKADAAKGKLLAVLSSTDAIDRSNVVWALTVLGESQAADAILEQFVGGMLKDKPGFDPALVARALGIQRLSSPALLTHQNAGVRAMTANALAEAASPEVVEPLGKLLESELARDTQTRSTEVIRSATEGLGRSGDPRAAKPLFQLLESTPSMRASVIDALGKSTAAPGLIGLLTEATDPKTRAELVGLLAATKDPRAADSLAKELENADAEIQFRAAIGLADLGDARAVSALLTFAEGTDNTKADKALAALRDVTQAGITGRLMAIVKEHPGRNAAVLRALGATKDPAAASFLEAALGGDDIGAAALALADLGSDSAYKKLLSKLPRPKNADMREPEVANETIMLDRKAAVQGVGRFGRADAAAALVKIIEDPLDDPRLRSLAAAALGSVGTDNDMAAAAARVKASTDDDTRAFYMEAFWQRPRPALLGDLLDLVATSTSSPVRLAAAVAVGYAGDAAAEQKLTAMLDGTSARDAAVALALFGSKASLTKVMEVLKANRDLEDQVRNLFSEDSDTFRVLTKGMFESGQFWNRARAGADLAAGDGRRNYPYAWAKVVEASRSGWDGTDGVSRRETRKALWDALMGSNDEQRAFAARILNEIPERGLLLRARDEGGPGGVAARALLRGGVQ